MNLTAFAHAAPPLLMVAPDHPRHHALRRQLESAGHGVRLSHDPQDIDRVSRPDWRLLLLDPCVDPPRRGELDAWWRLRRLRELHRRVPVIVLQVSSDAADRVVALELGADAVLDPGASPREVQAHVTALLRREEVGTPVTHDILRFRGWSLEAATRTLCTPTGLEITLSHAEYRLLRTFLDHPRSALPRQTLIDLARGAGVDQLDRNIDLLVSRLRHKLQDDPRSPRWIRTVRGVGYLFEADGA